MLSICWLPLEAEEQILLSGISGVGWLLSLLGKQVQYSSDWLDIYVKTGS